MFAYSAVHCAMGALVLPRSLRVGHSAILAQGWFSYRWKAHLFAWRLKDDGRGQNQDTIAIAARPTVY